MKSPIYTPAMHFSSPLLFLFVCVCMCVCLDSVVLFSSCCCFLNRELGLKPCLYLTFELALSDISNIDGINEVGSRQTRLLSKYDAVELALFTYWFLTPLVLKVWNQVPWLFPHMKCKHFYYLIVTKRSPRSTVKQLKDISKVLCISSGYSIVSITDASLLNPI